MVSKKKSFFFAILIFNLVFSTVDVSECGIKIQSNSEYVLMNNIINSAAAPCFDISGVENAIFDCQSHRIDGVGFGGSAAFLLRNKTTNVQLKNCIFSDFAFPIVISEAENNRIDNISCQQIDHAGQIGQYSPHFIYYIDKLTKNEYINLPGDYYPIHLVSANQNYLNGIINCPISISGSKNNRIQFTSGGTGVRLLASNSNYLDNLTLINTSIQLVSSNFNTFKKGVLDTGSIVILNSNNNAFSDFSRSLPGNSVSISDSRLNNFTNFTNIAFGLEGITTAMNQFENIRLDHADGVQIYSLSRLFDKSKESILSNIIENGTCLTQYCSLSNPQVILENNSHAETIQPQLPKNLTSSPAISPLPSVKQEISKGANETEDSKKEASDSGAFYCCVVPFFVLIILIWIIWKRTEEKKQQMIEEAKRKLNAEHARKKHEEEKAREDTIKAKQKVQEEEKRRKYEEETRQKEAQRKKQEEESQKRYEEQRREEEKRRQENQRQSDEKRQHQSYGNSRTDDYSKACETLGINKQSSYDECKNKWRNWNRILHRDTMSTSDSEAKNQAEEHLKKINTAWDLIKKVRGWS